MWFPMSTLDSREKFLKGNTLPKKGKKSKKKKRWGRKRKRADRGSPDAGASDTESQGGNSPNPDSRVDRSDPKLSLAAARRDSLTQSKNSLLHLDKIIRQLSMEAELATARLLENQKSLSAQTTLQDEVAGRENKLTKNETQKSSHATVHFPKWGTSDKSIKGHKDNLGYRNSSPNRNLRSNQSSAGHNDGVRSVKASDSTSPKRSPSSPSPNRNQPESKLRTVPYPPANARQRPGSLRLEKAPTSKESFLKDGNPHQLSNTSITLILDEFRKSSQNKQNNSPGKESASRIRTTPLPSENGHLNASLATSPLSDNSVRNSRPNDREALLNSLIHASSPTTMLFKKRSRSRIPHRIKTSNPLLRSAEDDHSWTGESSVGSEPTSPLSALAAEMLQNVKAKIRNSSSVERDQRSGPTNRSAGELRGLLKQNPLNEPDLLRVSSIDNRLRLLPSSCGNIRQQLYSQDLLPVSSSSQAGTRTSSEWSISLSLSSANSSQISEINHGPPLDKRLSKSPDGPAILRDSSLSESTQPGGRFSKVKIRTNPAYRPVATHSGQLTMARSDIDEEQDSFEKLERRIMRGSRIAGMTIDPPSDPSFRTEGSPRGFSRKDLPMLSSQTSTGDINISGGSDGDSNLSVDIRKKSNSPHRQITPSRHCNPGGITVSEREDREAKREVGADSMEGRRPAILQFLTEETVGMPRDGSMGSDIYRAAVPQAGTDVTFPV